MAIAMPLTKYINGTKVTSGTCTLGFISVPVPCHHVDKMARMVYLKGQWDILNQIAYQYGVYLKSRTSITQVERRYTQYLVDMINSVDAEGAKLMNELTLDALKDLGIGHKYTDLRPKFSST